MFGVAKVSSLLFLLAVATITDLRSHLIHNWNTYPGILLGFVLNWSNGSEALADSLKGFAVCGGLMLVCFVLFGLGGGDLKLMAMIGAFLGFERGVEALLWTLVLGGILGCAVMIWQIGFLNIVAHLKLQLVRMWKLQGFVNPDLEIKQTLKQPLFLAPAALLGVVIETWDVWGM